MGYYSLNKYFQNMPLIGSELKKADEENFDKISKIELEILEAIKASQNSGKSDEKINKKGQRTALQRIYELIDEGSLRLLNSVFNPEDNKNKSTGIIKALAKIEGKRVLIVASDNKKFAGALAPGVAQSILRAGETAKRLRIPLIYLLNCSGVKLDEQDKVYATRDGGGIPFYRNAELNDLAIPVIVGIYGTNPAGGGYHAISPTILIAHKDANMAVGGLAILGGMNPKGHIDSEAANEIADSTLNSIKKDAPGSIGVHYEQTGFMREAYADEKGVIDGIKKYVRMLASYDLDFFRVDDPKEPVFNPNDLYSIIPMNGKKSYDMYQVIARLIDSSQFLEYKKGYGPEMITGIAKIAGLPVAIIANASGLLMNYPEYKEGKPIGLGGKLYRQGLIKLNEFVTYSSRDRLPIIRIQDTSGIDVGDDAERAELLGLGQSLIYSIEDSNLAQIEITLRKGSAAAHYVLGGPQGNETNAFSLGTAVSEINVMNGETAANAMYSRRLMKDKKAGKDLKPTIDKMNELIDDYREKSRPLFLAKKGMVDEIVNLNAIRSYMVAFTESFYQDPDMICPVHQMILPRIIKDYNDRESNQN